MKRLWMKVDRVLRQSKCSLQPTDSRHTFLNTILDFILPISFQISITTPTESGEKLIKKIIYQTITSELNLSTIEMNCSV